MKRILVPTDFSEQSVQAFKFAVDIARAARAQLYVIHMVELPLLQETTFGIQPHPFDPELLTELEARADSAFDKIKSEVSHDVQIRFQPIHDYVVPGIRIFIAQNKIDLVVMSTHGASGLGEFFIGSTAEKIARFSTVPVISLPQSYEFSKIKNIVFPNSLTLDQDDLIVRLKEIQELTTARLHVLLVNTRVKFFDDKHAQEQLRRFVKYYDLKNYTLNVRNHQFERSGILEFMNEIKGDMLAMATHGRTGLSHFFRGSIAEAVLNRVDHPIWTYKLTT
jgi:nucleotide-binding universal stress UspA family protein